MNEEIFNSEKCIEAHGMYMRQVDLLQRAVFSARSESLGYKVRLELLLKANDVMREQNEKLKIRCESLELLTADNVTEANEIEGEEDES